MNPNGADFCLSAGLQERMLWAADSFQGFPDEKGFSDDAKVQEVSGMVGKIAGGRAGKKGDWSASRQAFEDKGLCRVIAF